MFAKSVYILNTQVISLSHRPFSLNKEIRKAFQPLFTSKTCFTDMRQSFRVKFDYLLENMFEWEGEEGREDEDFWPEIHETHKYVPTPGKPFLRGLGQLCFNPRSVRFIDPLEIDPVKFLARRGNFWDPSAPEDAEIIKHTPRYFGYDEEVEDQRMYHSYFELDRPIFIKALHNGKVQAQGNIFIHIFPSGYVTILVSAALMPHNLMSLSKIGRAILETYPWRKQSSWTWNSRLGNGRLDDIVERVRQQLYASLFGEEVERKPVEHPWSPAIRISTDNEVDKLAAGLFSGDIKQETIGVPTSVFTLSYPPSREKVFYVSSQGFICRLTRDRSPRTAFSFFWDVMAIAEFLHLKDQIYQDYADYLRPEIVRLRSYRLSMKQKMLKENVLKLSVYDLNTPLYLLALDTYIRAAPPTFRYIYSLLSDQIGFSRQREKVKEIVKEWEAEVGHWEHGFVVMWKSVLSPLRSLLGL